MAKVSTLRNLKRCVLTSVLVLLTLIGYAQDPSFSQPFATPIYDNPAFTGTTKYNGAKRISSQVYRQNNAFQFGSYTASLLSYDQEVFRLSGGLGLFVLRDNDAGGILVSNEVCLAYSYNMLITRKLGVRFGISGGWAERNLNFDKNSDYQGGLRNFIQAPGPFPPPNTIRASRLNSGLLVYSRKWFAGLGVNNIHQPEEKLNENSDRRLRRRYNLKVGWERKIESILGHSSKISLNATGNIQDKNKAFGFGSYMDVANFTAAVWYRRAQGNYWRTHVYSLMVGHSWENFTLAYAIDASYSTPYNQPYSHSLSLTWNQRAGANHRWPSILHYPRF